MIIHYPGLNEAQVKLAGRAYDLLLSKLGLTKAASYGYLYEGLHQMSRASFRLLDLIQSEEVHTEVWKAETLDAMRDLQSLIFTVTQLAKEVGDIEPTVSPKPSMVSYNYACMLFLIVYCKNWPFPEKLAEFPDGLTLSELMADGKRYVRSIEINVNQMQVL